MRIFEHLHALTLSRFAPDQEAVLMQTLPLLIQDDAISMPRALCFEPTMINSKIVKKALCLVEAEEASAQSMIRELTMDGRKVYVVGRFKSKVGKKLTKNSIAVRIQKHSNAFECIFPDAFTPCSILPQDYMLTLDGEAPVHYKAFKDADGGSKAELEALIEVCQSMHLVMPLNGSAPGSFISSELNPAELICTCKGFKISSNCSHEVAVTALFISDAQCVPGRTSFDKTYLENFVEKVARVTLRANGTRRHCHSCWEPHSAARRHSRRGRGRRGV